MKEHRVLMDIGLHYPTTNSKRKRRYYLVSCAECFNHFLLRKDKFHTTKSCGCLHNKIKQKQANEKANQFLFTKNNHLQMIANLGTIIRGKQIVRRILVLCDCDKVYEMDYADFKQRKTKSCGCINNKKAKSV